MEHLPQFPETPEWGPITPYQGMNNNYAGRAYSSDAGPYGGQEEVIYQFTPPQESVSTVTRFPFEVFVRGDSLVAAAGTITSVEELLIDTFPETVVTNPGNGTWTFEAFATINTQNGLIQDTGVRWVNTSGTTSNAGTTYVRLSTIEVSGGDIQTSSLLAFGYGPVVAVPVGARDNPFKVLMF
jgi:hypothetical protein